VDGIPAHDLLTRSPIDLIDPARAAAAAHLEAVRIPLWIVTVALQIAVLAWYWHTGRSGRLRDTLRVRLGSAFAVRFCFGALLALLGRLVALIPAAAEYRFVRLMDLTQTLFRVWLLHWIAGTILAMIVAGCIAAVVLWLADRTHQWYFYTIAGVIGGTLLVSYVAPYVFLPFSQPLTPLASSSAAAADVNRLERITGIHVPIVEQHVSGRTRLGISYVSGWGGSQRIVISDTLLAGDSQPEVRFTLARAYAWIAANSGLHLALIQGAFLVLGTAIAVFISDRIGFRRDDDPVSRLALLGAIMGGVYLVALPFYDGYVRNLNLLTDQAALALTGDKIAAVRSELRRDDQGLLPACPNPFAYWYMMDYPAAAQRIAALQGSEDPCAMQRR
jgi:STE24 endopeptidase